MTKKILFIYAGNIRAGGAMKRLRWELWYLIRRNDVKLHARLSPEFINYINIYDKTILKNIRYSHSYKNSVKELIYWNVFFGFDFRFWKTSIVYSATGYVPLFKLKNIVTVVYPSSVIPFEYKFKKLNLLNKNEIRNFILSFLAKRSVKKSDSIITLSSYMCDLIKPYIKHQEIHKSIHPIYPEKIVTKKDNYDEVSHGEINFLYVSHIADYKDQLWLIDCLDQISRDMLKKIHITFIGAIQNDVRKPFLFKIEKKYKFLKITHIDKLPFEQLDMFYHMCDCFLFGSKSENSPHILIEIIERSIPIICRNSLFNKYYLLDNGIYYHDYNSLLKCVKHINKGAKYRRLIGESIFQLKTNHNVDTIMNTRCDFITRSRA